ncbi:hypothetical protein ACJQWK_03779 [Exserohilum turcicum]|uniref:Uncharacterized protein n=1 Tax=Exserohilum turcicum (strain 28A) TaxID=671987 RepID=R0J4F6_EXST2|nr:uncharacterized protein SETTUDRAFT_18486 [Exserohilum turcica Et28A]EOA91825.1 hypothetical protein SETTUDRAFT_18486 [Exserohilum turcica Et28A]
MKTFSVIATLTILLPLAVALPTTSNNANAAKFFERQASCTDMICIQDTDCYGFRCGNCIIETGYCTCPPEAGGGPC